MSGSAFPAFTDDRMLRLIDRNGDEYDVPRFVEGAPEIAAFIEAAMAARSESSR